jgi:hypothetical protein
MITFKKVPQPTDLLTVNCEPGSYWKFGPYRTFVKSDELVMTVLNHINGESAIEVRSWISNCEWEPCNQDEFVEWYATAINRISAASGIEHLTLLMEANETTVETKCGKFIIDNTSNPES